MSKTALITGITGQDGAYLARLLLEKGYIVHGLRQPLAVPDTYRIDDILSEIVLHNGDLTDSSSIMRILAQIEPDEIYNLAAQSHVHVSFDTPEYTLQVNGLGIVKLLEAVRTLGGEEHTKIFQASTSEMFGDTLPPQSEISPMNPLSPYAIAKRYAYDISRMYRNAYGMFAANGIMFNHESPIRGMDFVTSKIIRAVVQISKNRQECLYLGNLSAKRDWSHAADIMEAVWLILQQEEADDFVLSSGRSYTVREFTQKSFAMAGFQIEWHGTGLEEVGIDTKSGKTLVRVDPKFFRPLEVENLLGDSRKAKEKLGWQPRHSLDDIIAEMYRAESGLVE